MSRVLEECREPTRNLEIREPEGWSKRLLDELKGAEALILDIMSD